ASCPVLVESDHSVCEDRPLSEARERSGLQKRDELPDRRLVPVQRLRIHLGGDPVDVVSPYLHLLKRKAVVRGDDGYGVGIGNVEERGLAHRDREGGWDPSSQIRYSILNLGIHRTERLGRFLVVLRA